MTLNDIYICRIILSDIFRKIDVRWGPDEGGREEAGEVRLTQYDLIMHKLIADCNDPLATASLPSFLAWVKLSFFRS